ncbi:MAG: hypothetical protein U1F71_07440 [Verrucomicrobiaceae bacterium]
MFEESKAWVFIFIIGMLIAIGYGAHYLSSVDSANAALIESKAKLADLNEIITQRRKTWADLEKTNVLIRQDIEKNDVLTKAREVLDKRYRAVESDLRYNVESMKSAVEKLRNNAPGTDLGDITLTNGKMIRAAKVRKVDESGISMIHADGIGTVSVDLLPADLKEKYDLGPDALVPTLISFQEAFLAKPEEGSAATSKAKVSATASASKPAPAAATGSSTVDEVKVKKIKLRIAELEARIESYAKPVTQYREAAEQHKSLAEQAKSRGSPSARHTADANAALAQAAQIEQQIASMKEELKKLEVELEYAQNPR